MRVIGRSYCYGTDLGTLLLGPDSQDQGGREKCEQGGTSERRGELNAMVTHRAKKDGCDGSDADAHHIHKPVTGCAMLRPDDLAKNRHVVAVKESPANPEQNHEPDRHSQTRRESQPEEGGHQQKRSGCAAKNAALGRHLHPSVGYCASEKDPGEGGELDITRRGQSGGTLLEMKRVGQKGRQPVFCDPARNGRQVGVS